MRKFFTAAVIAVALCAPDVSAASAQSSNARVGPVSDEIPAGADAATPKSRKKSNADSEAASNARKEQKDKSPASKTHATKESEGGQNPAVASSTPLAAPVESDKPASISDALPKSNPATMVPVPVPDQDGRTEAGGDGGALKSAPANTASDFPNAPESISIPPPPPLTSIYRIGVGDILDIRLLNLPDARQSTLYTVLTGGLIEYPLLRDPVPVAGMTTDELAHQLVAELRHRGVFDKPQVRVNVREYASHAVIVSGLVHDPGTKILRREAVPLYVVIAEAQPKPEAGRAVVISHATGKTTKVDLNDATAVNLLVQQGDVVNLVARPPEFFYIGGEINSPGQKDFHAGMTLTQALLASGGMTHLAGTKVKVSRQGSDGRLVSIEHNLKEIESGLAPDPALEAGDRIEVPRAKK